jgi:hypothetical protein
VYCCPGFRNLLSCAGERGHAILARVWHTGSIGFLLQSRDSACDDEAKLKAVSIDVKINISAEIGLRFWPFCGRRLEELVREDPGFFINLAQVHARYLSWRPALSPRF